MLDAVPTVEMHGNPHKGKNSQYKLLYQEAVKCAEEGMASDHSFKAALNALREARTKIVNAKKNAINSQKLETAASTNYEDENSTVASQVDSTSDLLNRTDHQQGKSRDSCAENNICKHASEQSSSRVCICTNCKCPGHDSHSCLWLKDARGSALMENKIQ